MVKYGLGEYFLPIAFQYLKKVAHVITDEEDNSLIHSERRWAVVHRTATLLSHDQNHSQRNFQIPVSLYSQSTFPRKSVTE